MQSNLQAEVNINPDNYVEILESDIFGKGEIIGQEEILKDGEYS